MGAAASILLLAVQQISFAVGKVTPSVDGVVAAGEYPARVPYMFLIRGKDPDQMPYSDRSPEGFFAWDRENLYLAMVSEGGRLKTSVTERDGSVWDDDSIDVIFFVNSSKAKRHHFIFNSNGARYDAEEDDVRWNAEGVRVANSVRGGKWHFEAAIPWKSMDVTIANWKTVRVNIARTYHGGTSEAVRSLDADETCTVGFGQGRFFDRDTTPFMHLRDRNSPYDFPPVTPPAEGQLSKILCVSLKEPDGRLLFKAKYPIMSHSPVTYRALTAIPGRNRLVVLTENWLEHDGDATIDLELRDWGKDSEVALKATIPAVAAHGRAAQEADISSLPPGYWRVHFTFRDRTGKAFFSDVGSLYKPDGKPPWTGFAGGTEDEVIPPWTAPEASAASFACWNREHVLGGAGLVTSIRSGGRELLAAPVSLEVAGEPLAFGCRLVAKGRSFADYELVAWDAPFPLSVRLHAEFDGLLWFKATYGGDGRRVEPLSLVVPLRRETVAAFDDNTSATEKRMLGRGVKGEWKWNPSTAPFWWAGDAATGLMGGIENCRGWHFRGKSAGARLSVGDGAATVRLNFVDEAFVPESSRTVAFYLEATPTKPKNVKLAAESRLKIRDWTSTTAEYFEAKIPGFVLKENCARYSREQREGQRVFWYNGTKGFSPVSPWWTWYGAEWNVTGDPTTYCLEIPQKDKRRRERTVWTWACLNDRGFYDMKNWSISWFMNESGEDVRNLYFDIGMPHACRNAKHGCVWKDEFGYTHYDWDLLALRETHKRLRRQLLKVNPDGAILGHLQYQRTPSDVFFDAAKMGEIYERELRKGKFDYYDVLTPEAMQVNYAMRANELVIDIAPQITRCMQIFAPEKLKTYDPSAPESLRAIRHAVAYFRIHDLRISTRPDAGRPRDWWTHDQFMEKLGEERVHSAYYQPGCPIRVSDPESRFLYSYDVSPRGSATIFLNDTDREVVKSVASPDFTGILTLGPREAKFIERIEP